MPRLSVCCVVHALRAGRGVCPSGCCPIPPGVDCSIFSAPSAPSRTSPGTGLARTGTNTGPAPSSPRRRPMPMKCFSRRSRRHFQRLTTRRRLASPRRAVSGHTSPQLTPSSRYHAAGIMAPKKTISKKAPAKKAPAKAPAAKAASASAGGSDVTIEACKS